jgi:uncharacterized glyoxalase superfamily protein PhnB
MNAVRSVSSEVEVAVDPKTAFSAFTEEMNLWWVRGPINFFDSARAVAKVCEPGVGGRILEVYDAATGEGLEVARITAWHPGERLAWRSSVDDVEVEVRFEPTASGTLVRVLAAIPSGGADRGGTAWVRVVPAWFGAWCARRDTAPREPRDLARLAVAVYYARPAAAARWLADAFGFVPTNELPAATADENWDAERRWIEFHLGNSSLMIFKLENAVPITTGPADGAFRQVPWVFVDDLDAHWARARARGATIVTDIHQHGYRAYEADDLESNRWTFAQARPTMR